MTEVLWEQELHWTLGAIFQVKEDQLRFTEYRLKDKHHGPKYCEICAGKKARSLPGATRIPISSAPYPTDSRTIRAAAAKDGTEYQTLQTDRSRPDVLD